jgi:hypothetical protein
VSKADNAKVWWDTTSREQEAVSFPILTTKPGKQFLKLRSQRDCTSRMLMRHKRWARESCEKTEGAPLLLRLKSVKSSM